MDTILGQKMRSPIQLRKFLLDYKQLFLNDGIYLPLTDINIQSIVKHSNEPEHLSYLETKCSLDELEANDEHRQVEYVPGFTEVLRKNLTELPSDAMKLKTLKCLLKSKTSTQRNPFQRTTHIYNAIGVSKNEWKDELDYIPGEELKIYVRVYRPARVTHQHRTLEKPVFDQEFECLGSNYLSDLRDKIQCVCNKKHFFDISENPEDPLPDKKTDPGYFFITDTFYNDRRNPNNSDYSEHIREWAKTAKGLSHLNFKFAPMEETRFIDLTVSMGFPQHYQHHGNCEHVFTFSQIELISTPLKQMITRENYPRLVSYNYFNNKLCNTCGILQYVYVVLDSNRQVHDPAYLCKKCFLSYHYVNGKKVGTFRAYRLNDCNAVQFDDNDVEVENTDEDEELIESSGEEDVVKLNNISPIKKDELLLDES